jgi:hypothetical protein
MMLMRRQVSHFILPAAERVGQQSSSRRVRPHSDVDWA